MHLSEIQTTNYNELLYCKPLVFICKNRYFSNADAKVATFFESANLSASFFTKNSIFLKIGLHTFYKGNGRRPCVFKRPPHMGPASGRKVLHVGPAKKTISAEPGQETGARHPDPHLQLPPRQPEQRSHARKHPAGTARRGDASPLFQIQSHRADLSPARSSPLTVVFVISRNIFYLCHTGIR